MEILVDGHCHRVLADDVDRNAFELACTEADLPPPSGVSYLDSQPGAAVRRWCGPSLGLPPHSGIDDYLVRRAALGWQAATAALLRSTGLSGGEPHEVLTQLPCGCAVLFGKPSLSG